MGEDRPHAHRQLLGGPVVLVVLGEGFGAMVRRADSLVRAPCVVDRLVRVVGTERVLVQDRQVVEVEVAVVGDLPVGSLRRLRSDEPRVGDAEVRSFIKKQSQTEGASDESLLAHILIQIPEGASQNEVDEARQRAEDAANRVDSGMDFRQVAAEMSDATDALDGGMLGWRDATTLPGLFVDAVKEMRVGGRSDVLQSPNGFHILFLFDKRGLNAQVIVQETLARHILIRVDELSSDEDALREITNIRNQILFDGADFSELAKSSSDDGSASNGGLLNWMMPGETVEPFDRAMNNLKIGEVSEPVRTQFGYHLIEVIERRDADVSEERREAVARQSIRQKKLEFRFQEWVQEVKDTTYIKYVN